MNRAADETAKIEHELDILRSRYAIFERWGKIMRWYFIALAVVVACFIVSNASFDDPLAVIVITGIVIVIGAGLYLARDRDFRWIDAASPPPGWPHHAASGPWSGPQSEAIAIEAMIAEREARLTDIRKQHA